MKKGKKRKECILFVAIICVLCGCAKAPSERTENGINHAVSEGEESIINIIENDTENENTYLMESKEGIKCVASIGNSDNVINIDAIVADLDMEVISHRKAEPFPHAINRENVVDIFFGGEANAVEKNNEAENIIEQEKSGERAVVQQMETTGQWLLESVDGNIHFIQTSHAGFDYRNDKLITQYKQIETGGNYFEEQDKDISDSYTVDMAKKEVQETFSEIINIKVQIISCNTIFDGTGNGVYDFLFVPMIENLPLAINDRETNTDNIVDVYGRVQIGKEGIALIEANNLLWKDSSISNDSQTSLLRLEKVLDILQEYIAKDEISGSERIIFTKVSLVWLPITDNWKEAELIPVWRFYIPCIELIESGMLDISITENVPTDICINAIDGKIENIQ